MACLPAPVQRETGSPPAAVTTADCGRLRGPRCWWGTCRMSDNRWEKLETSGKVKRHNDFCQLDYGLLRSA